MKIGIIGNGFVGNAIYQNVKSKISNVFVFDADSKKSYNTREEVLNSDIVFVCLPTPMKNKIGDDCDLSYINSFFSDVQKNQDAIFVIKSTVPIGTTKKLCDTRPDLKIIHNPEFLTARNSVEDFNNADRNIIGGKLEWANILNDFYIQYFPHIQSKIVSSDESESIKYFSNTYLSIKVAYFNLIYDLCQKLEMDFDNVRSGISMDARIGPSHTLVPGIDGDRGFGGTCFPKDLNALLETLKKNELDTNILKSIWYYNLSVRKNIDW